MYITRDPIFFYPAVHASSMDRLRRCLVAVYRGHGEEEQSKHVFRALGERQISMQELRSCCCRCVCFRYCVLLLLSCDAEGQTPQTKG